MPTGRAGGLTTVRAFGIFKHSLKPKSASELVRHSLDILTSITSKPGPPPEKALDDLERLLDDMVFKLYGDSETHPSAEETGTLTADVFRGEFFSLLVKAVPLLKEASRQPAVQIIAGVQSASRQSSADYLQSHPQVLDVLLRGYDDKEVALFYGSMLRDCLRHQGAARYVLQSPGLLELFRHIEAPQFEIASDAATTLKELLLKHKSTAAEFVVKNQERVFTEFNRLLESEGYITKRTAAKLLADMLQDRAYSAVLAAYVADISNLRPVMNMLKDQSKNIQLDGYQVFRVIACHPDKSPEIRHILASNKEKIKCVLAPLKPEKGSEAELAQFQKNKEELLATIGAL